MVHAVSVHDPSALVVVAPSWPVLAVRGSDAASWLNGIITCDTLSLAPTRGSWGLLLSKTGKVQAELSLVGAHDDLRIGVSGGQVEHVLGTLEHYLVMEDAELSREPELGFICLYGATALAVAQRLGAPASEMPWGFPACAWVVPVSERASWLERARSAGASLRQEDDAELRVALGLPRYGVDFGETDNPHEAGLERRAVSWSKGCYLGQEVVCMQDMRGRVKRRLVRLRAASLSGPIGSPVTADGAEIGRVTSWGSGQAIASLVAPWFEPGREVEVLGQRAQVEPLLPG